MLFFGIKNFWFRLAIFLPLTIAAILFIGWMYHNYYVIDPYNPELHGTAVYGHNGEDAFKGYAIATFIEYAVLLVVLLPLSFSHLYFVRVIILQVVYGFWLFVMFIGSMHNGYVHIIHVFWLFVVNIILFPLLLLSFISEVSNKSKLPEAANWK